MNSAIIRNTVMNAIGIEVISILLKHKPAMTIVTSFNSNRVEII